MVQYFCIETLFHLSQGGVIFYTDPLAADDSKPDSDNIRIMIMTKVTPHPNLIGSKNKAWKVTYLITFKSNVRKVFNPARCWWAPVWWRQKKRKEHLQLLLQTSLLDLQCIQKQTCLLTPSPTPQRQDSIRWHTSVHFTKTIFHSRN